MLDSLAAIKGKAAAIAVAAKDPDTRTLAALLIELVSRCEDIVKAMPVLPRKS